MKAPAFQFYPDDFLSGTITMTDAEVGLYIRLLCHQWNSGGLPNDNAEIELHSRGGTPLKRVLAKFQVGDDGLLRNARLEAVRRGRQEFIDKQTESSAKGVAAREAKRLLATSGLTVGQPSGQPVGQPTVNPERVNGRSYGRLTSVSVSVSPKEEEAGKKKSFDVSAIEIPEALNTASFLNAWDRWCAHRRELKRPLTKISTAQQLNDLAEMGESRAIATLHHSVKNGWQGIFEPAGSRSATASEVPSGPRSWRNTPSSEWTPEDHAAYEKA